MKEIYDFYQKIYKVFNSFGRQFTVILIMIVWFFAALGRSCSTDNIVHFNVWLGMIFVVFFGQVIIPITIILLLGDKK